MEITGSAWTGNLGRGGKHPLSSGGCCFFDITVLGCWRGGSTVLHLACHPDFPRASFSDSEYFYFLVVAIFWFVDSPFLVKD